MKREMRSDWKWIELCHCERFPWAWRKKNESLGILDDRRIFEDDDEYKYFDVKVPKTVSYKNYEMMKLMHRELIEQYDGYNEKLPITTPSEQELLQTQFYSAATEKCPSFSEWFRPKSIESHIEVCTKKQACSNSGVRTNDKEHYKEACPIKSGYCGIFPRLQSRNHHEQEICRKNPNSTASENNKKTICELAQKPNRNLTWSILRYLKQKSQQKS